MSSVILESRPGFYRRQLSIQFEPSRHFSTGEAASCVYIAHVLAFVVIFFVALDYDEKQHLEQAIYIELTNPKENSSAVVAPAPLAAPPAPALVPEEDYEVGFKKIFDGGKNIDSTSGQGAAVRHRISRDAVTHDEQLTKIANTPLPFRLPSPHFTKPPLSVPAPILAQPSMQPEVNPPSPVEAPKNDTFLLPMPKPGDSDSQVSGPIPQPILKPSHSLEPLPILHDQQYFQPDVAPIAVQAVGK